MHATFVIGLHVHVHVHVCTFNMTPFDACYCKVMLPCDVSGSKLKCNVPCSAEKFILC